MPNVALANWNRETGRLTLPKQLSPCFLNHKYKLPVHVFIPDGVTNGNVTFNASESTSTVLQSTSTVSQSTATSTSHDLTTHIIINGKNLTTIWGKAEPGILGYCKFSLCYTDAWLSMVFPTSNYEKNFPPLFYKENEQTFSQRCWPEKGPCYIHQDKARHSWLPSSELGLGPCQHGWITVGKRPMSRCFLYANYLNIYTHG